jgi:ketosteroid isomerase-like protein
MRGEFMKHLMLIVALVLPVAAQEPDAEIHNALRRLKTTMEKALNERDLDTIVANVDPNVVFTTMNNDVRRGPQQIRAYFHEMLTAPGHIVKDVKVSFDVDALTSLYGGDTGVAYGSSNDMYELTNGDKFNVKGRWSCTMVRSGEGWRIASFHYSTNVFDNPILDRYRSMLVPLGAGGVAVGLILGWLIGRMMGRRRTAA